jgi:hypothetical protein
MHITEIQKLYEARPFRPFVIHVADGRTIKVEHPEFMAQAPTGRTIFVYDPKDFQIIDVLMITGLEVKTNGASSRKRKR